MVVIVSLCWVSYLDGEVVFWFFGVVVMVMVVVRVGFGVNGMVMIRGGFFEESFVMFFYEGFLVVFVCINSVRVVVDVIRSRVFVDIVRVVEGGLMFEFIEDRVFVGEKIVNEFVSMFFFYGKRCFLVRV